MNCVWIWRKILDPKNDFDGLMSLPKINLNCFLLPELGIESKLVRYQTPKIVVSMLFLVVAKIMHIFGAELPTEACR